MEKKKDKTAVEWLFENIKNCSNDDKDSVFEIAKAIEMNQHLNKWLQGIKASEEGKSNSDTGIIDFTKLYRNQYDVKEGK